jgi:hypothetical protein
MTVPDFQSLMLPILFIANDGQPPIFGKPNYLREQDVADFESPSVGDLY